MTVTLELNDEQKQRLLLAAQVRQVDTNTLLSQVVTEAIDRLPSPAAQTTRVLGLHAGQVLIGEGFDDPLPDEYWLGTE